MMNILGSCKTIILWNKLIEKDGSVMRSLSFSIRFVRSNCEFPIFGEKRRIFFSIFTLNLSYSVFLTTVFTIATKYYIYRTIGTLCKNVGKSSLLILLLLLIFQRKIKCLLINEGVN